jgi:hypothetical protein
MVAMVRTGIGVVCVALLGIAGCNKTPEDPGLTASASASASATDASSDEGTIEDDDETAASGQSATSGQEESGEPPPASSSGMELTTGPETTGEAGCGDGMVVPGEQCDGADLQGFDCASLGLGGGTLACDPVTCSFDTSMCMSTSSGTSG